LQRRQKDASNPNSDQQRSLQYEVPLHLPANATCQDVALFPRENLRRLRREHMSFGTIQELTGLSVPSAFAKQPGTHGIIHRQIRATKNMIRNARRILGDKWHGFLSQCTCAGRRILKEGA